MRKEKVNNILNRGIGVLMVWVLILGFNESLNATTKIEGEIDSSLNIDSFSISYTINSAQEDNIYARGEQRKIRVVDHKFRFELDSLPDTFYILFRMPSVAHSRSTAVYSTFIHSAFLLRSGNDVKLFISPDEIRFLGKDREIFDCQFELFQLKTEFNRMRGHARNQYDFDDKVNLREISIGYLNEFKGMHDRIQNQSMELVESKYNRIDQLIRNQILFDFIGRIRIEELNILNFNLRRDRRIADYLINFYTDNYLESIDFVLMDAYLGKSTFFARYLSSKIALDLAIVVSKVENNIMFNLPLLLEIAAKKYAGEIFDQVAFSAFLRASASQDIDENTYWRLLSTIDNTEFKEYINDDMMKTKYRPKSFQFQMMNEKGGYLSNADLQGKVVLFDFWFTGCAGCISLHKKMKFVKDYFRDNPDVVFVSICVDSKEELWKKSILSGSYTDEEDVKLWIGSRDLKHPIIKHYNVVSYPTMVLVDAEDRVVTMNPPIPNDEKKRRELIYLIERAIVSTD